MEASSEWLVGPGGAGPYRGFVKMNVNVYGRAKEFHGKALSGRGVSGRILNSAVIRPEPEGDSRFRSVGM